MGLVGIYIPLFFGGFPRRKLLRTLEEVLRSYGRAIDLLGSDWRVPGQ